MSTNETAPGGANANDSMGGGGGGKAVLGSAGEQSHSSKALFLGFIYPAPLDKDGQLVDQPLSEGLGAPQMAVVVYGYNKDTEGASRELHAGVDEKLGQPFFKAYIYPVKEEDDEMPLISFAGGGGGKAVLGGAATQNPIYLGQLFATMSGGDMPADE
jgi:hypothetical protein